MARGISVRQTDDEIRRDHEGYSTDALYGLMAATVNDPRARRIIRRIIKDRDRRRA